MLMRVVTLINYVEMFSLLGVLNMEGRVWFEDKLTRINSFGILFAPSSFERFLQIG